MTAARIRALNDAFRTTFEGGTVLLTAGARALPSDVQARAIRMVATFDAFDGSNDPHGEHDFGAFDLAGHKFFWKIDYYDAALRLGSPDPTDTTQTARVLTIMIADEY